MVRALLAVSIALAPAPERKTIEFTTDSLDVVKENIAKKKALLVDVRSVEEWREGHVEGSIFVPIDSLRKSRLDAKKLGKLLPKKEIIYTHCVVGMRAKTAAKILGELGYTVRALKPGYEELLKAGFKAGESRNEREVAEEDPAPAK